MNTNDRVDISDTEDGRREKRQWKLTGKQWLLLGMTVMVLAALVVGIGIYSAPKIQLTHLLDLGHTYLENQQYEEAILAFEEAIAIDARCVEAYANGIEAYRYLNDQEGQLAFYDRALEVVENLPEENLNQDMDHVVAIYLSAGILYGGEPERAIEILEEGYRLTSGNPGVMEKLVDIYLGVVEKYTEEEDYQESLKIYDRLWELVQEDAQVQEGLKKCLLAYLDDLMENGQYDEIRKIAGKYAGRVKGVDFQDFLDKADELERVETENRAFMQKIYELMEAEDYVSLCKMGGSAEETEFLDRMVVDRYIYIPEEIGPLSGTGVGIYRFGEDEHCFFFGDYVEGERVGNGVSFIHIRAPVGQQWYYVFTGEWDADAPNGQGRMYYYWDNEIVRMREGIYTNGLEDGVMKSTVFRDEVYFSYLRDTFPWVRVYTAQQGIPDDKTNEFRAYLKKYFNYSDRSFDNLLKRIMPPNGGKIVFYYLDDSYWDWIGYDGRSTWGVWGFATGFWV